MSESFSSPYTSSALLCFMAAIQCLVIGAGVERKLSARSLGWDIRLAASLYICYRLNPNSCGLYLILLGKGRELKKLSNIGGKNMEEELKEGGGTTVAISMPKCCSPGHEAQDAQP